MSHVRGQPRQTGVQVHALAIPLTQPVNCESMTQVVRSRASPAFFRLQSGQLKQTTEGVTGCLNRQPLLIGANKKARVRVYARVLNAATNISVQFLGKRPMKRHPACPPLECIDKKDGRSCIHIPYAQPERFSKTNASTVQDQNERPVKHSSKMRMLEVSAKRQQIENVLFTKKIGDKLGLRRQMRPERFNNHV